MAYGIQACSMAYGIQACYSECFKGIIHNCICKNGQNLLDYLVPVFLM